MTDRFRSDRKLQRMSDVLQRQHQHPLTLKDIKRVISRLRDPMPFWDAVALCFLIDVSRNDVVVMPWGLIEECEHEGGRYPAWVKGADFIKETYVLREDDSGPDVPPPSHHPSPATCSSCAATNLQHFYRSNTAGMIFCSSCLPKA
jgi:hypothetical protein